MDRRTRHRVLQTALWSRLGLAAVHAYLGFSRRWEYVVMNRSLLAESNGEYWLLSHLPATPLIVDVGFNRGDFSREALRLRPRARIVGFDPAVSMVQAFATAFADEPRVELLPFRGVRPARPRRGQRLLARQAIDIFSFEYNAPWIACRRFLRDAWTYLEGKPYRLFRLFNGFLAPFQYSHRAERHDLGCVYVGVSTSRLGAGDVPTRAFPG
jgi:hypothetical protein